MRPLAVTLAAAGFSVELPLLPGHGTSVEDMIPSGWNDWCGAAEAAYAQVAARTEQVFAAGLSMGGSLAIWLAERHPEIAGLVVVNPLVEPAAPSFKEMLVGMLEYGGGLLPSISSDIAMECPREPAYDATPIAPMISMFDGIEEIAAGLGGLRCPVLLLSSRKDHVVPAESGDLLAAGAGGPVERVWLERSFHVATLDYDAAEIEARAVEFVNKVAVLR